MPSSTFTNSGTLNGVAFDNNLDLATTTAAVTITGGLTLDNADVYLGNTAGSTYGQLDFYGTHFLGGTGTVVFGPNGSNGIYGAPPFLAVRSPSPAVSPSMEPLGRLPTVPTTPRR